MGGYHLLHFTTSSVSRLILLARPIFPISVRRYTKENYDHHAEEKAPTTAEEFTRVAEEMAEDKEHLQRVAEEKEQQGFSSQTLDKAQDAMKEATTISDSNFESVKGSFKEDPGKGDFHKKGDDSDDLLKSTPHDQISS